MAPEQLHGATVTRQTDVYAAAVVTWEALTGRRLFRGDNEAAIVTAVLQAPLEPPSQVASHVPLSFDRVVMRGLERDPARRYATAREMAVDLERCVGVASSAEVGDWVEALAHDELLKRASHVAEIESMSSPMGRLPSLPTVAEMPTTVRAGAESDEQLPLDVRSDVSSIAVSPILSSPPRRPRGRVAIAAGIAGAGVAVALVLLLAFSGNGAPAAAATGATAAASVVPDVDPATATATATATAPASAIPSATDTAVAAPLPTRRRFQPPAPPAAPRRPSPADCDPPFTIDDKGHKHYKPACLQ
jgi:serine/threonine-protein kinase